MTKYKKEIKKKTN